MIWALWHVALSCWKKPSAFKRHSIGTKGPKVCQWNIPPLHHHHPEPLRQGRMDPCFHVLYAKFWPYHLNVVADIETHQTRQRFFQSSIVQFWWACVNCSLRFLFLADRSGTRCGLLLLEPICFRVRRVVRSEMVFCIPWLWWVVIWVTQLYRCLSMISNQSAHSPLTSDINKAFLSTQLPLTGNFLFYGPFSVNPRDGCVWKSQQISRFWNTQISPSGTNNHSTFKVT